MAVKADRQSAVAGAISTYGVRDLATNASCYGVRKACSLAKGPCKANERCVIERKNALM
jgi:hypothetical protein